MSRARLTAWTLLAAAGFALAAPGPAFAQDPLPQKNNAAFQAVRELYQRERGGIKPEELKTARESFAKVAKYYADVVAHPSVWKTQDFKVDAPGVRPLTIDFLLSPNGEIDRLLLEPVPGGTKIGIDQVDYIRELGLALDTALRVPMETHPERIVRVNAARVLAHVARTGAPAHFGTATVLLANPETPTEVRYYLFHVAAAALSAYDAGDINVRKHSADPKVVGALVKVVQDSVTNPALLLPEYKPAEVTADQVAVIALMRRQAIKALAQVKFAAIPGPDGKALLYPAHTLARIALSDTNLFPAPTPADTAESVIGICNMQPPAKGYNSDAALEAVVQGLLTFASPRAANVTDRTLPWRAYSLRLAEALMKWRPLFDPVFNIAKPTVFDAQSVPAAIEETYKEVVPKVLARIEKADAAVNVEINVLRERLKALRGKPKRNPVMFAGIDATSIDFLAPKPPEPPPPPKK